MSKYPGRIVTDLADTGYSVAFDGTGDYLTVANNAALNMEAQNFTFECWIQPLANASGSGAQMIVTKRANNSTFGGFALFFNGTLAPNLQATVDGGSWGVSITSSISCTLNAWSHIAVTRNGNNWTLWVNGVSGAATTLAGTIPTNTAALAIGAGAAGGTQEIMQSLISNVRLVKGTAVYTAPFSPPTQLLPITNTSLLACQSPTLIDTSSNNFPITPNGNVQVSTITPFRAYTPYNPSLGAATPGVWTVDEAMQAAATRQWNMYDPYFNLTTLLLHGNGTNGAQNNTFLDSSANNFSITRNGNTTQGTFSPFSQTGWSNFFDGTGDYLSLANAGLDPTGTNDFTFETWVYNNGFGGSQFGRGIFTLFNPIGGYGPNRMLVRLNSGANVINFYLVVNSVVLTGTSGTDGTIPLTPYVWSHLALVRRNGVFSIYINGVLDINITNITTTSLTSFTTLEIGRNQDGGTPDFFGYLSNFRYVRSQALSSGNFTPPTSPATTTSVGWTGPNAATSLTGNVALLTCQNNRFIDNSSNNFAITANGTVSTQPFNPFLPTTAYSQQAVGSSGYFDGGADWLSVPVGGIPSGAGTAFTLEAWIYPRNNGVPVIRGNGNGSGLEIVIGANNEYVLANTFIVNFLTTSNNVIRLNEWHHLAVTRTTGNVYTIYVNGVSVGSTTYNVSLGAPSPHLIGYNTFNGASLLGYINSFRVTSSLVYTTNFTPPSQPLTAIANTQLMLSFNNAGIIDSTADNVLETVGNTQISTAQSRFGGASMLFDGNGDYLILPASPQLNISGGGAFTIECFVYTGSSARQNIVIDTAGSYWDLCLTNYAVNFRYNGAGVSLTTSLTVTPNAWNHVAVVWTGSAMRLFVNGVMDAATSSTVMTARAAGALFLGYSNFAPDPQWMNGYIDEFRITKFARYTGNFTPQTSQWQDQ